MNFTKLLSIATAGLLPVLGLAQTTVSYDTSVETLVSGVATPLSFTQFDPTLGSLSGINIEFSYQIADFSYTFTAVGSPATVSQQFYSSLTNLSGTPTITSSLSGINLASSSITQGNLLNFTTIPEGDSFTYTYTSLENTASGAIASAFWDDYTGVGAVTVNTTALTMLSQSVGGSNVGQAGNIGAGTISGKITYAYIPEPSTYALIFGALTLGLVGWRRFRK